MNTLEQTLSEVMASTAYKFGKVTITPKPIQGTKLGYAGGTKKGKTVSGYIVLDSRYVEYCKDHQDELLNTVRHELAHLIAETLNTKKKRIWHGQAWKDVFSAMGGDSSRFYTGGFVKPENVGKVIKTTAELYKTQAKHPATDWDQGTYRQWLERGYHVIKGQKGQIKVWEFSALEYETQEDGKTSKWGRASAVYFTPGQVEANAA